MDKITLLQLLKTNGPDSKVIPDFQLIATKGGPGTIIK
jgi:hypothetical protein